MTAQAAVYLLSAATSLLCSLLLLRSYFSNGARLLLWSALCFAALTIDNVLLFTDMIVFPDITIHVLPGVSLDMVRKLTSLSGLGLLIYGMVWDVK